VVKIIEAKAYQGGRSYRARALWADGILAAIIDIPPNLGYAAVFAFIAIETMGIPVPGERR
jgi:hypothetical protein